MTQEELRFDGDDYVHTRDVARLTGQILRVHQFMTDWQWHTLAQIAAATGAPEASASAQLRNLRKVRFGKWEVSRRHVNGGLYEYRLEPAGQEGL